MSLGVGILKKKIQFLFQEQRHTDIGVLNCRIWVEVRAVSSLPAVTATLELELPSSEWPGGLACSCLFIGSWLEAQREKVLACPCVSQLNRLFSSPGLAFWCWVRRETAEMKVFWKRSRGGAQWKGVGAVSLLVGIVRSQAYQSCLMCWEGLIENYLFYITMFIFPLLWHQCPTLTHLVELEVSTH